MDLMIGPMSLNCAAPHCERKVRPCAGHVDRERDRAVPNRPSIISVSVGPSTTRRVPRLPIGSLFPSFAVDTWRTPKLFLRAHLPDQRLAPCRSAAALAVGATSNASSGESRPDANAPASLGRMIVGTRRIDGTQRYSWIRNQRS